MDYVRYQIESTWGLISKFERGPSVETWQEKRLYSDKDSQEVHEMFSTTRVA